MSKKAAEEATGDPSGMTAKKVVRLCTWEVSVRHSLGTRRLWFAGNGLRRMLILEIRLWECGAADAAAGRPGLAATDLLRDDLRLEPEPGLHLARRAGLHLEGGGSSVLGH